MKAKRLLGAFLAAGLGLMAATHAPSALAEGAKGKTDAASAIAGAPMTKKAIALPIAGIAWGQSPKQVAAAIDKVIDEDHSASYKTVQPGVEMKSLDAQVAEEKSQFRRSRIDFGKLPTGVDATPLRGEYTYQNKETLMTLERRTGGKTHFFFIQDRLWKIIVEYKLTPASQIGKTYMDAMVKLTTIYGVPGRVTPPDDKHWAVEVDWKDGVTHIRAIQRNDTAFGLAFEDNATVASLDALRPNKPVVDDGIDPAVAAAVRGGSPDPGPPPPKKDDKKK
jgi:hypothetical protein